MIHLETTKRLGIAAEKDLCVAVTAIFLKPLNELSEDMSCQVSGIALTGPVCSDF